MTAARRRPALEEGASGRSARVGTRLGDRKTVLVVEDNEVIRRVLCLLLEAEGYAIVESSDGRDLVRLVREIQPDAITLDLRLPNVDGLEILNELRATHDLARTPVVILSAFADTLTATERALADEVVVKPFDLDDLLAHLGQAIGRAERRGEASRRSAGA